MAMEFKGKDESFVSEWLTKQGFKGAVVDAFVRKKLWQIMTANHVNIQK